MLVTPFGSGDARCYSADKFLLLLSTQLYWRLTHYVTQEVDDASRHDECGRARGPLRTEEECTRHVTYGIAREQKNTLFRLIRKLVI